MKTCATCRFWGLPGGETEQAATRIREDSIEAGFWNKVRPCGAVAMPDDSIGPHAYSMPSGARAEVVDGSGYYASLRTREDFGCVLHEESKP